VVTIGFPEVTYSLGLGELTETLCLIPILICFRLAEQLSKLIVGWIFSKDAFVPAAGCSHRIKHVFLYYLDSCMVSLMYERVLLYTIFIRSNLSCKFLMPPVLKIMHMLNFLDTFSTGVTFGIRAGRFRSCHGSLSFN